MQAASAVEGRSLNSLTEAPTGFPGSSAGKESTCNAGDPSLIPGLGRSPEDVIGYPLQYSWASLVAQMVKNSPAMWETCIQPLGWEDPLEEGMATPSTWRIPMDREAWPATFHSKELDMTNKELDMQRVRHD